MKIWDSVYVCIYYDLLSMNSFVMEKMYKNNVNVKHDTKDE